MLGASNSEDMVQPRADLQSLTTQSSNSSNKVQSTLLNSHDHLASSFTNPYDMIERQISGVETLLGSSNDQISASQRNLHSYYMSSGPSASRRPRRTGTDTTIYSQIPTGASSVGLQVAHRTACHSTCNCKCHAEIRTASSKLVDRVFGQLFVGYAGLPYISPKCDDRACGKVRVSHMSVEYWFPLAFIWSQIVRLRIMFEPGIGPHMELSTLRRIPDSAPSVSFALNGDIDALKDLFGRGLASPKDVSSTRGYSLLRWAMYGKQYQTCEFLVHEGADLDYRPIAISDNSPRDKAHQYLLMGGLAPEDVEALETLTRGSDFIEEQQYNILHEVILGLRLMNLEEQICLHPELLNKTDAKLRTPLAWAACRGDEHAIVTLLQHGAEVNTIDIQNSSPVCHAADRGFVVCVRLLLEAGAETNYAKALGSGGPLNCASRNASDPLVVKSLLEFGAEVDACGVDGMTCLIHASRRNHAIFAMLFLEHGADINAVSTAGQTPLSIAVINNSHDVLRLLLERWFEFSECPRLKGPHLLQLVAVYADIETMQILTSTDHLLLSYDRSYTIGEFMSTLESRTDVDEKLVVAFNELLAVIRQGCESRISRHGSPRHLEEGLLAEDDFNFEDILQDMNDPSDSDSSTQEYVIAPE